MPDSITLVIDIELHSRETFRDIDVLRSYRHDEISLIAAMPTDLFRDVVALRPARWIGRHGGAHPLEPPIEFILDITKAEV